MTVPRTTTLFFAPTRQFVEAHIVEMTPDLADRKIHLEWWADPALLDRLEPAPIDRFWNWNEMGIEFEDRPLAAKKLAVLTGDDALQGAMTISTQGVPSVLESGRQTLFVELLFTAPRNRPSLRRDGKPWFLGVGTGLLSWAAWLSREKGYEGRLRLDGSPDYVGWYQRRGLQTLGLEPSIFEDVPYTPMELPPIEAKRLLEAWD